MKKIYNLIALFVMLFAAVGINAQKYALLDEVSVIEDGVQYALFNVSNSQNAAGANVGVTPIWLMTTICGCLKKPVRP